MIFWGFSRKNLTIITSRSESNEFDQVLREHFDKIMLYFFVNQSPFVVDIPKLDGCQANTISIIAMARESLSQPVTSLILRPSQRTERRQGRGRGF